MGEFRHNSPNSGTVMGYFGCGFDFALVDPWFLDSTVISGPKVRH